LRAFIAIELPESLRSALAGLQQDLQQCKADIRWVKPDNIHLTLKFLGEVDDKEIDPIVKTLKDFCTMYSGFSLEVKGVGVFPNIRSPRVLWVDISGSGLLSGLQKGIEDGLSSLGFNPENRRFVPHLTLGRFRSSAGKHDLHNRIEQNKDLSLGSFDVMSVSLMRSDLSPAGARYTRIAGISLGYTAGRAV
jgi:2'-5' RNA ligase